MWRLIFTAVLLACSPALATVVAGIVTITGTVGTSPQAVITNTPSGTSIVSGMVPPGTVYFIAENQGILGGTPTQAGSFAFDVSVSNLGTIETMEVFVTISPAPAVTPPVINGVTILPPASVGVPYSASLGDLSQIPNYVVNGVLPPGLSIQPAKDLTFSGTAVLAGTPTQASNPTDIFQLQSQNAFTNTNATFSITVNPLVPVSGTYFDPTQGGTGWSVQLNSTNGHIFLVGYTFDDSGGKTSAWVYSIMQPTGVPASTLIYSGTMYVCGNGTSLSSDMAVMQNVNPTCAVYGPYGTTVTLTFTAPTTMQLSYGMRTANLTLYTQF